MTQLWKIALISLLFFGCSFTEITDNDRSITSEALIIQKISDHVYQHTSFLQTQSFGRVGCNKMVVYDKDEAIIFETPADKNTSVELKLFRLSRKGNYFRRFLKTDESNSLNTILISLWKSLNSFS